MPDTGEEAKIALERKVGNQPVACEVKNKDMYGRNVSVCYGGGGKEDLNAWMVSQGEAVPYTEYSKNYLPQGKEAEAAKKVLADEYLMLWKAPPSLCLCVMRSGGGFV